MWFFRWEFIFWYKHFPSFKTFNSAAKLYGYRLGYSDFHNLMGFTSKKMPNFKMFVKKVFQLVKPFLANLYSTISKKYSYMYSMTPKLFYFFFNIWVSKNRWILRRFQICGNNLKKVYLEKVICQKLVQVSSIEEYKLQFCTLLLPVTFLLAYFLHFSQQIPNQRKILSCFDIHVQILWRKSF